MTTLAEVIARHYPSGYTCGCGIEVNSPGGWGEHVAEDVRAWFGEDAADAAEAMRLIPPHKVRLHINREDA